MTTKILQALLIGALLSASAAFADTSIQVSSVGGQQQANFTLGDAKCVLVGEEIRCMPVAIATN